MVLARARPRGPIANAYLVLNLCLAGDRMVNAQSYLIKPKSYEIHVQIFLLKTQNPVSAEPRAHVFVRF